jgi:gliding motility-associated-like protein
MPKKIMRSVYLILSFFSAVFAAAQCPTVVDVNPQFCDLQAPQVADLIAIDNGAGFNWFESATSIAPLDPFVFLSNGQSVFIDNAAGNCGTRVEVIVTVTGRPTGSNFQGICINDGGLPIIQDLFATGNDVRWYDAAFGGNELPLNTRLVNGEVYYADQANPVTGCRTSRLFIQADVVVVSTPVGNETQVFCNDPNNPPKIVDLITDGDNRWYETATSVVPLDEETLLVDGEDYFATSIELPCESVGRLRVIPELQTLNDAGVSAVVDLCEDQLGSLGTLNLFDFLNGTPETGGTWTGDTPRSGGSLGTIEPSDLSLINSPFNYTYTVSDSDLCPADVSTVTINISRPLIAGTDGSIDLCENDASLDLFTLLGGTPDMGGTWTPSLTSGTGIFNPSSDSSGVYTYTVGPTTVCNAISSAEVTVTVDNLPDTGISSTLNICSTEAPVDLFNILGGAPDTGGTWNPSLVSTSGVFDPLVDLPGVYTYTIVGTSPCNISSSSTITVNSGDPLDAGTDGSIDLCENDSSIDLFTLLGGVPDTGGTWSPALNSGTGVFNPSIDGSGVYIYTVGPTTTCSTISSANITVTVDSLPDTGVSSTLNICSTEAPVDLFNILGGTPDTGGTWNPSLVSASGVFDPSVDLSGVYTYTILGTSPCNVSSSSTITVNSEDPLDAGTDGSIDLCENDISINLFTLLRGTPDTGGTWSPALTSGTGVFNPRVDNSGVYTYNVGPSTVCTAISSANVTVTVDDLPDAGISSTLNICATDLPLDLFTVLGGTPDAGGTWSPALTSGSGVFDPAVDLADVYTYVINATLPCNVSSSSTVAVNIDEPADAGTNSSLNICEDAAPIDLFNLLGGTPDTGGTWSPALNSSAGVFDPSIDTSGVYTYEVSSSSSCNLSASATITVTVDTLPNAGLDGSIDLCIISSPVDLINVLGGTPDAGGTWSPPLTSGSGVFIPFLDTSGVYTYTVGASSSCNNTDSASATVTVFGFPNTGGNGRVSVCTDEAAVDLFDSLGGSPDTGGTWNPALASGTGIFDPSVDSAGRYTYSIFSGAPCNITSSSSVIVTLENRPDPGENSSLELCADSPSVDLFTALGGTPETGGVWSPALNSGTGILDPSIDPSGIYTYTIQPTGVCTTPTSATVSVSISALPDAGANGSIDVCEDALRFDLFTILGGTPDAGGVWSPTLSSGGSDFNPAIDISGIYTYTVNATSPCSGSNSSTVTVNVQELPDSGNNRLIEICPTDAPLDLFTVLGGTPDAGGTWSPALASGSGIFDPSVDLAGQYIYTVSGTAPCTGTASSTVTVNIPFANAGTDGVLDVCSDATAVDLFTLLGGTPDAGGTWSPALTSGSGIFDPSVDLAGTYRYTVISATCGITETSEVIVNIQPAANAGNDASIDLCPTDAPLDLFTVLGGTPDTGGTWSPALVSGSGVFDPSVDLAGQYIYTVSGTAPCTGTASSTVTVNIPVANAGTDGVLDVCSDAAVVDLFTLLGGTPDVGGTWSPALTSGSGVFDPSVDLSGTYTYTVISAACGITETSEVIVNIQPDANAGNDASIDLCPTDAPLDLFTVLGGTPDTGGTWSPLLTSGSGVFDPSIDLAGTYTYTVISASCGIVETAEIIVNVQPAENAGNDASIDLCPTEAPLDLFTVLGGTPDAGGTWSPALASGNGVFDPAEDLAGTYTYTVISAACRITETAEVVVTVQPAANAGSDASIDFCTTDAPLDLFTVLGGTPDAGGTWSPALTSGSGVFDPSVDLTGDYTYTITGVNSCGDATATITVSVQTTPNAGTNGVLDVCSDAAAVDLFTSLGGTPDAGGTWSPALTSGSGVFDPSVDLAGTYTYTVISAACGITETAEVVVTVQPAANAGSDASIDFCATDAPSDLFTVLGGTPDAGGTWSPALASGSGIFDPAVDLAGDYTYTVTGVNSCGDATAKITVSVQTAPDAGTNGVLDVCSDAAAVDLFTLLGGTPDAGGTWSPSLTSGSGVFDPAVDLAGTYTYTVISAACGITETAEVVVTVQPAANAGSDASIDFCATDAPSDLFTVLGGTPDTSGTWSPALVSGSGVFDPAVDLAGDYTYTVTGVNSCGDATATITVSVQTAPNAGTNGVSDVCSDAAAVDLFTLLGGTPDSGGTWSPALVSGNGVFDPAVDLAGTYTYTVISAACGITETAEVVVTVQPEANAGSDASIDFCATDAPSDLFTVLGGTPDAGGTWSPALTSGSGVFDPSVDLAGDYTYTVTGVNSCGDATATITVSIQTTPNAGTNGVLDVCSDAAPSDLFTVLGGTPDAGGTWSPALVSGSGVFDPAVDLVGTYTYTVLSAACGITETSEVVVTVQPEANAGSDASIDFCATDAPSDLFTVLGGTPDAGGTWSPALASGSGVFDPSVDLAGDYTYTVTGVNSCGDATATITVSIQTTPNAGTNGVLDVCSDAAAVDLFTLLGGSPDAGGTWSPSLTSGSGVFDPSVDLAGTYTYTVISAACGITETAEVVVTVQPAANAGSDASIDFCATDAPSDLFTVLGGTPDPGGTWSPALASGSGVFDPAVDLAGDYTYSVTGVNSCGDATSTITVSVQTAPDAGTNGVLDVCSDAAAVDLFTLLGGTPDAGGSWSPALVSGNGVFDPAVDLAGTYTYTVISAACGITETAEVVVSVQPTANAGSDASIDFCTTDTPSDLFTLLGGTQDAGGTWSPALASGTGVFDPAVDLAGDYTYTVTGVNSCGDATAIITVSVQTAPDAGTNGVLDVCSDAAAVDLFTLLGGTPDAGGTWSPSLTSGSGVFDPSVDLAGIYTYTAISAACGITETAEVVVTIQPAANAGSDASIDFCATDAPSDLFTVLGGTPDAGGTWSPALASGTGVFDPAIDLTGDYTYTVIGVNSCGDATATITVSVQTAPDAGTNGVLDVCSDAAAVDLFTLLGGTPDAGGTWSPSLTSGSGVFDPAVDLAGTYTYTVISAACGITETAEVVVTVQPAANAGSDASIDFCATDAPSDLFTVLGGTPDPGGTWSPALVSGSGVFDPSVDLAGDYTYTVTGENSCGDATATITVSIQTTPDAGTNGVLDVCSDAAVVDLFTLLGGTPDAGGTWSPALASGSGVFDPSVDLAGTYTYTVLSAACALSSSAVVTVNVEIPIDLAAIAVSLDFEICLGDENFVNVSGLGLLADGFYDLEFQLTGANNSTNIINVEVVAGVADFNIDAALLNSPGITNFEILRISSPSLLCDIILSSSADQDFEVIDIESLQLIIDGNVFCAEDNPTLIELTDNIITTLPIFWFDSPTGGNALNDTAELSNGATYYAEVINSSGCSSLSRLAVTVLVEPCDELGIIIPDGFSPNGDGINDTFNIRNIRTLYPDFTIEIFNRNGNILFQGNANIPDWDGIAAKGIGIGDDAMPAGVYFYILNLRNGTEAFQGRVYLSN